MLHHTHFFFEINESNENVLPTNHRPNHTLPMIIDQGKQLPGDCRHVEISLELRQGNVLLSE